MEDKSIKELIEESAKLKLEKTKRGPYIYITFVLIIVIFMFIVNNTTLLNEKLISVGYYPPSALNELMEELYEDMIINYKALDKRITNALTDEFETTIDLETTSFQYGPKQTLVSIQNVESYLSGLKIKGEILNPLSYTFKDLKLQIEIDNTSNDLYISKINPGCAAIFEINIPNVSTINRKNWNAKIKYVSSMISYNYQY